MIVSVFPSRRTQFRVDADLGSDGDPHMRRRRQLQAAADHGAAVSTIKSEVSV